MKARWLQGSLAILLILSLPAGCLACTTFCLQHEDHCVLGRNFDWTIEDGLVIINKRNMVKISNAESNAAKWTSQYGSITFNQYGRELPMGGMNEAGLAVESMWLSATEYPPVDSRPALFELQWIQYQLDTAASIEEVIASDSLVRISTQHASTIHYLVCDRQGACASIEFLGGQMVVHFGNAMPATVLTNSTYRHSKFFLESFNGNESSEAFLLASYSLKRFLWAAQGVAAYDAHTSGSAVDYAFSILKRVSVDDTQWSIVYDLANSRIHFRTLSNQSVRYFDLNQFDFSCDTPVKILDLSCPAAGDVNSLFIDYTYETNYAQIAKAYSETEFLKNVPDKALRQIAMYPEGMQCVR